MRPRVVTLFIHSGDDADASEILDNVALFTKCGLVSSFFDLYVTIGMSGNTSFPGRKISASGTESCDVLGELARVGIFDELRIVALSATATDAKIEESVRAEVQRLKRSLSQLVHSGLVITDIRFGVRAFGETLPSTSFFAIEANCNVVAIPQDRRQDSTVARPVQRSYSGKSQRSFAMHGAAEVASFLGLWNVMNVSPADDLRPIIAGSHTPRLRFTQSRVRMLVAPPLPLQAVASPTADLPIPTTFTPANSSESVTKTLVEQIYPTELSFQPSERPDFSVSVSGGLGELVSFLGLVAKTLFDLPRLVVKGIRSEIEGSAARIHQELVGNESWLQVIGGQRSEPSSVVDATGAVQQIVRAIETSTDRGVVSPLSRDHWSRLINGVTGVVDADDKAREIRATALGNETSLLVNRARVGFTEAGLQDTVRQLLVNPSPRSESTLEFKTGQDSSSASLSSGAAEIPQAAPALDKRVSTGDVGLAGVDASASPQVERQPAPSHDPASDSDQQSTDKSDTEAQSQSATDKVAQPQTTPQAVPSTTDSPEASSPSVREARVVPGLVGEIARRLQNERDRAHSHIEIATEEIRRAFSELQETNKSVISTAVVVTAWLSFLSVIVLLLTCTPIREALDIFPSAFARDAAWFAFSGIFVVLALFLLGVGGDRHWQARILITAGVVGVFIAVSMVFFDGIRNAVIGDSSSSRVGLALALVTAALMAAAVRRNLLSKSHTRRELGRLFMLGISVYLSVGFVFQQAMDGSALDEAGGTRTRILVAGLVVAGVLLLACLVVVATIRFREKYRMRRSERVIEFLRLEVEQTVDAWVRLKAAHVQWSVTGAALLRMFTYPFGRSIETTRSGLSELVQDDSTLKFDVTELHLNQIGAENLISHLRTHYLEPGWLHRQYDIAVQTFQDKLAARIGVNADLLFDRRPETDPVVYEADAVADGRAASQRWRFAQQLFDAAFDAELSATPTSLSFEAVYRGVLADQQSYFLNGAQLHEPNARDFLSQVLPVQDVDLPTNLVGVAFTANDATRGMQSHVWWPSVVVGEIPLLPKSAVAHESLRLESQRWDDAVVLVAVRVDVSEPFEYTKCVGAIVNEAAKPIGPVTSGEDF
jgi:hypothetical protein